VPFLFFFRFTYNSIIDTNKGLNGGFYLNGSRRKMFIYPYLFSIIFLFLLGILQYLIPLVYPWLTKIAIDDVLNKKEGFWTLNKVIVCFFILQTLSVTISYINSMKTTKLNQRIVFDLRIKLYNHMQKLPKKYFDNERSGNIATKIFYDPLDVSYLIQSGIIGIIINFSTMIFAIIILIKMNLFLTIISIVLFPLYHFLFRRFNKKSRQTWREIAKERGNINGNLTEKISGIFIVKSFNQEETEKEKFENSAQKLKREQIKAEKNMNIVQLITNSFNNIGNLLIWAIGGAFVLHGKMTTGELVAFQAYIGNLYAPVRGLSVIQTQLQSAFSSIERMEEFLSLPVEEVENENINDKNDFSGEVKVENICFSYDDKKVLNNISFHVKPGEVVAFVGESGGGKSTTFNLLSRFYQPDSGNIYFDGINSQKIKLSHLRKNIGIVTQDNFLFSGSILDNIQYGKPDASLEEIKEVIKAVNLYDFIERLENKYGTLIGERGIKLSGGQKQRIALARTLLKNPKILLLDEATSALDTETESIVVESLERISHECTTFIIAHRLSTVLRADRIYVIENGKIVEEGNHQTLLKNNGRYASLCQKQFFKE
jgi:subfamily B ATP-binding cassette protein MsbA